MINEYQLNQILYNKNLNRNIIKSPKTFFGSPLKKFVNNIYNQFEIPKESFYLSMYYIRKFYNYNKNNKEQLSNFFTNINYYIFVTIILSLKLILDETLNIRNMCTILFLDFEKYKLYELELLKGLNWNINYNNTDYYNFKQYLYIYVKS